MIEIAGVLGIRPRPSKHRPRASCHELPKELSHEPRDPFPVYISADLRIDPARDAGVLYLVPSGGASRSAAYGSQLIHRRMVARLCARAGHYAIVSCDCAGKAAICGDHHASGGMAYIRFALQ